MAKQWCLDGAFKTNAVYNRLADMDYEYVVGLDIGDGESMAYIYDVAQNKIDRLHFNFGGDKKIPTMIAIREDGSTVIGREAANCSNFRQHFKRAPSQWNTDILKQNGKTYTFKYLMKLFISTFWSEILENDDRGEKLKEAQKQNKLLITVGCPSSTLWTGQNGMSEYQKLVREATNCNNVAILAESTAAIMSALLDSMDLNRGIAIFDAGSSTIDFTYVLLGKKLITRSLDVAGAELDKQLLATATAIKRSGLSEDDIPEEQKQEILVQLREMKESYYPNEVNLGSKFIPIYERNSYGMVDKNLPSKKYLNFEFNSKFVNEAINTKYRLSHTKEDSMSWLERCDKFIRDCLGLINTGLCSKVILTGGTSFVTDFKDAVVKAAEDAHIGGKNVVESTQRDASVARGLCYAKAFEMRGRGRIEAYKKNVSDIAAKNYWSFLRGLAQYYSKIIVADIQLAVNELDKKDGRVYAGMLVDNVKQRAQADSRLVGTEGKKKIKELFEANFKNSQEALLKEVNVASKAIYGAELNYVPEIPALGDNELQEMVNKLNLSDMVNQPWFNILISQTVLSIVIVALIAVSLALQIYPLAGALAALSLLLDKPDFQQKVSNFIMTDRTWLPHPLLKSLQKKLNNPKKRESIINDSVTNTLEGMRKSNAFGNEFKNTIIDSAEVYLGKTLFLVYDERPDEK